MPLLHSQRPIPRNRKYNTNNVVADRKEQRECKSEKYISLTPYVNGNNIYYEDNDGYWVKQVYNQNNNRIYYENSDGVIRDRRYE